MLSIISTQYNDTWRNDTQDDTPHNDSITTTITMEQRIFV